MSFYVCACAPHRPAAEPSGQRAVAGCRAVSPAFTQPSFRRVLTLFAGWVRMDGDGSALTFSWAVSAGTLGAAVDSLSSSDILWKAPTCSPAGGPPGITATVTNARGFTASHTFSVTVLSGVDCSPSTPDAGTSTPDGGTPTEPGSVARWTPSGHMLAARSQHSATLLPGGKVLVIGGFNNSVPLSSAELYDPATGAWAPVRNMAQGRAWHTVTQLPDGKVLVIGGSIGTAENVSQALDSAEVYDPATNRWSAAAPMTFKRFHHTATLLPDGRVLVAGGYGGNSALTRSILYTP